ncbi:histidine phosphatase family protein [Lysobacter sp. SG-8]|uniref:Histidine phosphatase family protein n=1 Tax=Marilutibacter penaei TaxID=2759900 RepID=A0A7W3U1V1_9GAMM|nr:phosphoglycerate mutase family protein [Lysobacter penaei]MBB1087364.1 histidine phosphatase family protein [Lysobacter penaei]
MRLRPARVVLFALLLVLVGAACAAKPGNDPSASLRFVVVRHAEKAPAPADDPALTPEGEARAARLAASLANAPLVAVYATDYARTRDTAAPSAAAHGLAVTSYDAREPAAAFVAGLRARHESGTVLVVGHSNTVPGIAGALCGCAVAAMDESEYDHRFIVDIDASGAATLVDRPLP